MTDTQPIKSGPEVQLSIEVLQNMAPVQAELAATSRPTFEGIPSLFVEVPDSNKERAELSRQILGGALVTEKLCAKRLGDKQRPFLGASSDV